jgi:hypothetical protein
MEFIYDWKNKKTLPVRGSVLVRNPLFTLWLCTVAGRRQAPVVPVVEYFNGAVYVPADLDRDFSAKLIGSAPWRPALPEDVQWVRMRSGTPAILVNGFPL